MAFVGLWSFVMSFILTDQSREGEVYLEEAWALGTEELHKLE